MRLQRLCSGSPSLTCFRMLAPLVAFAVAEWTFAASDPAVFSSTATKSDHWAFLPVRDWAPPKVQNSAWPRSDIDRFILAKLEEHKLQPAPSSDKRTLLRRASYDLTGLPPTPEEVDVFPGSWSGF